jgi:hypothetical protein
MPHGQLRRDVFATDTESTEVEASIVVGDDVMSLNYYVFAWSFSPLQSRSDTGN